VRYKTNLDKISSMAVLTNFKKVPHPPYIFPHSHHKWPIPHLLPT